MWDGSTDCHAGKADVLVVELCDAAVPSPGGWAAHGGRIRTLGYTIDNGSITIDLIRRPVYSTARYSMEPGIELNLH